MTTTQTAPKRHNLTAKSRTLRKVTLNFAERNWTALGDAAKSTGHSQTESVNRAVALYAKAIQAFEQGGAVYVREDADAKLERISFL
jgi:hypothetical protein